jgi:DNA-binding winged helix-turn-helix (wHTH) protein/TolB-like protein
VYEFGAFRYDPGQRLLFREGEVVPLVPKAIDALEALLERRGRIVEKAELMKLVWPDCVVEEVGLARNISLLRKALGDEGEHYIETIPRRGYRFAAAAAVLDEPGERKPARRAPNRILLAALACTVAAVGLIYWQFYRPSRYLPQAGQRASLAVVPIQGLSPELQQAAFTDGFTDTLVAEISKLESVQVISPSTVRRYERIGVPSALMARILGLHVIVEGTAQKLDQQVRISVRLTDVHSGKVIWAENYDAPQHDLGKAETGVAQAIAAEIGRQLSM